MGVVFARFDGEDSVIGFARNTERNLESQGEVAESSLEDANTEAPTIGVTENTQVSATDIEQLSNEIEPDQE